MWQQSNWPGLTFDPGAAAPALAQARRMQGEVDGKARAIGIQHTEEIAREILTQEVIATSAIEGEKLDPSAVRSSVMRRLGLADAGPHNRNVDALVEVIDDAATHFQQPLDHDRLQRWHSALFPGGTSGIHRIAVGRYRDHEDPMQIVSGTRGNEKVHYEAPPSHRVRAEMDRFVQWFAATAPVAGRPPAMDGLARAAIAHVWFETIHPFEDGNGRIGRAISDMAIAQDRGSKTRLYSLSRQLLESHGAYYQALSDAQHGVGDVTAWVTWFAGQISSACARTSEVIEGAIQKTRYWSEHAAITLNQRQRKVLQRLLDDGDGGFLGGLNAEKYMKVTGTSKATATRDLSDLLGHGLLWTQGQGKALRYYINMPGWTHGVQEQLKPPVAEQPQ